MPKRLSKPRRTDRNTCGKMVAQLRYAQGLTQPELAARAQVGGWNISEYAIKRIEAGEREVTDIEVIKLAKLFRIPPSTLLSESWQQLGHGPAKGLSL